MKNLKRLSAAVLLTCLLGLSALAGETSSPPCAPPIPGETSSPPCSGGQVAPDPATPAQAQAPSVSVAAEASEFAINLLESLLLY